uniref:Uncharacterized protein n=1 Tax=Steinernema glaseri TaxID=37863 RepID=A0A1I8A8W9_9BILA
MVGKIGLSKSLEKYTESPTSDYTKGTLIGNHLHWGYETCPPELNSLNVLMMRTYQESYSCPMRYEMEKIFSDYCGRQL